MRVTRKDNWRVEVEIEKTFAVTLAEMSHEDQSKIDKVWQTNTDAVAAQIRRHIDGAEHVMVKYDLHEECSLCGLEWETEVDSDRPVCCNAAIAAWEAESTVQADA